MVNCLIFFFFLRNVVICKDWVLDFLRIMIMNSKNYLNSHQGFVHVSNNYLAWK
jgi:hypothetical protein